MAVVVRRSKPAPRRVIRVNSNSKPRKTQRAKLDGHPEVLFISSVLQSGNHVLPQSAGVAAGWFHAYPDEWAYVDRYITKFRRTPTIDGFMRRFPDFDLQETVETDEHLDDLKASHARFVLLSTVDDVAEGISSNMDYSKLVRRAELTLISLQSQLEGTMHESEFSDWSEVYKEVSARAERYKKHGIAGVPTGFQTLDDSVGGFQPGEFWVVAARLGMGKTWTAVSMATHALLADTTVQYDALEQSRVQVALRVQNLLRPKSGRIIRSIELLRGQVDLKQYKEDLEDLSRSLKGKLFINDTPRGKVSASTIAAQIERNHPQIAFIDYITLMDTAGGDDWRAIKKLSGDLRGIAMEYQVPIVAMAQINRSGGSGRTSAPPGAEMLSGSDAIGQDADGVITLARPSSRVIRMKLAKYRHGPDGQQWWNIFDLTNGRYLEVSRDEAARQAEEDEEDDK